VTTYGRGLSSLIRPLEGVIHVDRPPTGPDPIDVFIGTRVRWRLELGILQPVLARRVGVTFQAVQKYEAGEVRLAASKLYRVGKALDIPLTYFFEGYADPGLEAGKRRKRAKR